LTDRATGLRGLAVGDIFHARSSNGASLVCLVTAIHDRRIDARRIHTQDDLQFDRYTGFEAGKDHTRIDCIAQLPPDIRNVLLNMDRRYQNAYSMIRQGVEVDPEQAKQTPDERRAHDFLHDHIKANPL
jgi:hypothetical protein